MAIRGSSITRNSTIFPGYLCIFFLKRSKKEVASLSNLLFFNPVRTLNESLKRSNFRIFARNGRSSNRDEEKNGGKFERKAIALAVKRDIEKRRKGGKKIRITKMKLEKKKNVRNRMYRRTVLRVCLVSDAF